MNKKTCAFLYKMNVSSIHSSEGSIRYDYFQAYAGGTLMLVGIALWIFDWNVKVPLDKDKAAKVSLSSNRRNILLSFEKQF